MSKQITVLSFKPSGKYYTEHIIELPHGVATFDIVDFIKAHRTDFPAGMDLLVLKSSNQDNARFALGLIRADDV